MGRNQRDGVAGFLIILLLVAGLGIIHPPPPDPWDIGAYPLDPAVDKCDSSVSPMPVTPAGGDFANCDALPWPLAQCSPHPAHAAVDEDGDGLVEQFDPSCVALHDTNGNNVCDTRVLYAFNGLEAAPDYLRHMSCTGWE